MNIVFASHNQHKTEEVRQILGPHWNLCNLHDLGQTEEIPETSDTLQGNALQKAQYVCEKYHVNCFADDTGLEVEALDGAPGVYSARYAGEHCSYADNVNKLLHEMQGRTNRRACFKTVVALILDGEPHVACAILKSIAAIVTRSHDIVLHRCDIVLLFSVFHHLTPCFCFPG